MNFLETIFDRLARMADRPVLQEIREGQLVPATGGQLLASVQNARAFLNRAGLQKGERCALLAPNSIHWAAVDLAILAEGGVVVPLYARQAPGELVSMMKDCAPLLICCGDRQLRDSISALWPQAPPLYLLEEILADGAMAANPPEPPCPLAGSDPVTIIYTSGTSGEPKGVVLSVGNLNHMLRCTTGRLNLLLGPRPEAERIFHYLPFCFCASWIALLSFLSRHSILTLSTGLAKLAEEIPQAAPEYFLNVPALLERVRGGVESQLQKRGGFALKLFENASSAWSRRQTGKKSPGDTLWLMLAQALLFPAIRKRISRNLKALICGSAPLAQPTQQFFMMLGIPVLQVYGLTETTGICTMDHPQRVRPGRVGLAIDGIEMRLGDDGEILVRGPNLFQGYWNRPEATAEALRDGWFHTGDQGEVDETGNWSVTGRIKNLIVLSSGHNVAPEPIEDALLRSLPGAQQVMLVGNGRSHLAAILAGDLSRDRVAATLESLNRQMPHYKRIHVFHLSPESFTADNGLLTANGKLKRAAIAARFRNEIEELYRKQVA